MSFPRVRVRPGREEIAAHEPVGAAEYLRPFANEQLNSRLATRLPRGDWRVKWKTSLTDNMEPRFVMRMKDRLVVQGATQWQFVLTADGRTLKVGNHAGAAGIAVDGGGADFSFAARNGFAARHDSGGELEHLCPVRFGENFQRIAVRRAAADYYVASLSYGAPRFGVGEWWVFEKISLGDARPDAAKVLKGTQSAGLLMQKKGRLLAPPAHEGVAVLATANRLYFVNDGMKIVRAVVGDFEPLTLSLDERGRAHLVVREGDQRALWVLTPEGELLVSFRLPPDAEPRDVPPIVGYDHRVYVLTADRVLSVGPDEKLRWARPLRDNEAGAIVTGDDQLLVTDGPEVAVFDQAGRRQTLYRFADDARLRTPPVLTREGEIFVATNDHLYSLSTRGEEADR